MDRTNKGYVRGHRMSEGASTNSTRMISIEARDIRAWSKETEDYWIAYNQGRTEGMEELLASRKARKGRVIPQEE